MDEILKITIGTVAGFVIAFFAEPVKIYFQNASKKKSLRLALYGELINNFMSLRFFLNGLDMTEKLLFRFADTLVWNDGVIPAWQNTMRLEINKCLLCV